MALFTPSPSPNGIVFGYVSRVSVHSWCVAHNILHLPGGSAHGVLLTTFSIYRITNRPTSYFRSHQSADWCLCESPISRLNTFGGTNRLPESPITRQRLSESPHGLPKSLIRRLVAFGVTHRPTSYFRCHQSAYQNYQSADYSDKKLQQCQYYGGNNYSIKN